MNLDISDIERVLGFPLKESQREVAEHVLHRTPRGTQLRLCLYHRTGEGKTIGSLAAAALAGAHEVLVLAPPITHPKWVEVGETLGVTVTAISHAKFRQKPYKVRRDQAIIVDEFHLLGGHTGAGWKKMDRLAAGLQAPLIICSATPNYNDAERVYCVMHVLAPDSVRGGYIQFLYSHCETTVNPFGSEPIVDGFRNGQSAEEFLAALPYVHYVEDEAIKQVVIRDIPADHGEPPDSFDDYGLDRRAGRVLASQMEERHRIKRYQMLNVDSEFRTKLFNQICRLIELAETPVLIYCDSSEIAIALHQKFSQSDRDARCITGTTSATLKHEIVHQFIRKEINVLIGTATMATGLDGVDKMCDVLLIVDDTDDDAKRRQLMGRILPRGLDTDVSKKQVLRLVYS